MGLVHCNNSIILLTWTKSRWFGQMHFKDVRSMKFLNPVEWPTTSGVSLFLNMEWSMAVMTIFINVCRQFRDFKEWNQEPSMENLTRSAELRRLMVCWSWHQAADLGIGRTTWQDLLLCSYSANFHTSITDYFELLKLPVLNHNLQVKLLSISGTMNVTKEYF